jgi:hypothetical protein
LRLYFDTKPCIAATSERAATPTNVTFGLAAATWLTLGPSALQNGHHGVQNHSTAGLPIRLAPLNGAPDSVVPVNCSRSSATAAGGLTSPNASAAAAALSTSDLVSRENRLLIPHLLRSSGTAWMTYAPHF